jgi:hypothetical protein
VLYFRATGHEIICARTINRRCVAAVRVAPVYFYIYRALKKRNIKKGRIDGRGFCTKCAFTAAANDELINKAAVSRALKNRPLPATLHGEIYHWPAAV